MRLLEREAELATVDAAVAALAGGSGGFLRVEGPLGIGRTALLAAIRKRAAAAGIEVRATPPSEPPDRPLAIVVDDAQDEDADLLAGIARLVRRVPDVPALVVLAIRLPVAATAPAELHALMADPRARTVAPAPLSERAVAALTGADPPAARDILQRSGGLPLLVTAPAALERRVSALLAGLREPARQVAVVAAVLGEDAEPRHVAALTGLSGEEVGAAGDALTAAGLFADGRPLTAAQPLIAETLGRSLPAGRRSRLHRRAAERLAAEGAAAMHLGRHLQHVDPAGDPWVVEQLMRAAALEAADDRAAAHLERALAEPPPAERRVGVLMALGRAQRLAAPLRAAQCFQEVLEHVTDAQTRKEVHWLHRIALFQAGRSREALEARDRAVEELGEDATADGLLPHADPEAALARIADAEAAGDWAGAARATRFAGLFGKLIDARTTADHLLRAVAGGLVEQTDTLNALFVVWMLEFADRLTEARRLTGVLVGNAVSAGSRIDEGYGRCFGAIVDLRAGRLREAETALEAVLELATELQSDWLLTNVRYGLAMSLLDQGRLTEANAVVQTISIGRPPVPDDDLALFVRGRLRLELGQPREGGDDILHAGALMLEMGTDHPGYCAWRAAAVPALVLRGERERAQRLAEEGVEMARAWGAPGPLGVALRGAASAVSGSDRPALLQEAVDAFEGSEMRLEHARTLVDHGVALRRARRRADARDPLRRGLDLAVQCGAAALAEQARGELAATGSRPRRDVLTGIDSLTPSERRVVRLAAAGRTNREISETLFLSTRTVEAHLRNVYFKLGVASRRDLPGDA